MSDRFVPHLPQWIPVGVQRYLVHTEAGQSIRDLARAAGCHASTVMRQIRRVELRRDDPLVDASLETLSHVYFGTRPRPEKISQQADMSRKEKALIHSPDAFKKSAISAEKLAEEGFRILRRLCESGAVLAVAENMEKAVVIRNDDSGNSTRTAVVDSEIAQAMALKEWIACASPGRISRYRITATGRSAISQMLAQRENQKRSELETGFAEAQAPMMGNPVSGLPAKSGGCDPQPRRRARYNVTESPLSALSRRKDKDGSPFLEEDLVHAGERLREDFELAQMGEQTGQDWDSFLTPDAQAGAQAEGARGPAAARHRVSRALSELGPGLADVALRCCCYLEGLEVTEKKMGWSARSGKIVLRIALQRLRLHYANQAEPDRLIG